MQKNINEEKYVNYVRLVGLKTIAQAGLGHLGMTISAAPLTHSVYTEAMHISTNPKWINRDRFVLSAGHGSTSLYPLFYLSGLMSKDFLVHFKEGSHVSASHPEVTKENYIDASTGPIGQGVGMAVGMAIAEKFLEKKMHEFPGIIDHYTYAIVGDGDMQEGACQEAFQIAGTLNLKKLIVLYDGNYMQIDSPTKEVNRENTQMRMESLGFDYQKTSNDPHEIKVALQKAQKSSKPSFIEVETIIAEHLATENSPAGHYGAFSKEDFAAYHKKMQLPMNDWEVPQEVSDYYHQTIKVRGAKKYQEWVRLVEKYKKENPEKMKEFSKWFAKGYVPTTWLTPEIISKQDRSIRDYFKDIASQMAKEIPNVLTLNADLGEATKIRASKETFPHGNHLLIGIREFAMANILNGINLHGGITSMASTFLVFSDYLKSAYRLGAMMELNNTFIFSHDSYQVGSDGPTHQPYDQIPMLRSVANTMLWRPANELETLAAFQKAFSSKKTTNVIIGTRQPLKSRSITNMEVVKKDGIYAIKREVNAEIVIAASGSEVDLGFLLAEKLSDYKVRIVSVPALTLAFENQQNTSKLLEASKLLVTLEATSDANWYRLRSFSNAPQHFHFGSYEFGFSHSKGQFVYESKGFSVENLLPQILAKLA